MVLRTVRSVVPPPRVAVTGRSVAPLVVFVLGSIALLLALEAAHVMLLSRHWPLALIVAVSPWVWWMHVAGYSGLSRGRAAAALGSRFMLLGLLAVLLAEPRAVRSDDRLSVMYVIDASASVAQPARDEAIKYVLRVVDGKPERDEAGLMFFGRNAAVELPPGVTLPLGDGERAMNVRIDRDGTDLAAALSTAAAVLPDDRAGRIVLVSDGVATAGRLDPVLDDLRARGVAVDVLGVEYRYEHEVWLERLDLPEHVKLGEAYEAVVLLGALTDGRGRLVLRENDAVIHDEPVEYAAGKSRYIVPIRLRRPGYYEYAASIEPANRPPTTPGAPPEPADSFAANNRAIGYLYLKARGQVLVVIDPDADERDWKPMTDAMRQAQREVTVLTAFEAPSDSLALLPYDCIVLANAPRDTFSEPQLQAIHDAVRQQGSGLLMVGGPHSFGPGAWARTPVEQALPVSMDITQKRVLLNGAMMLVLDHSGSMQGNVAGAAWTKQMVANNAAAAAIRTMAAGDWLGVIAFDSEPTWIAPLQLNRHPDRTADLVRRIAPAGGTDMYPALEQAADALASLAKGSAAVKHVLLMTDGHSAEGDTPGLVARCRDRRISISTIGVGDDVNDGLLSELARETGGRYHKVVDPHDLPRVFIREAATLRRSAIRNDPFVPVVAASSPILKGIDAAPRLEGHVVTTPKPRATIVLAVPPDPGEDAPSPLLATWRYGVGAAAAFTSDLSANWGKHWIAWERYEPFIKQLLTEVSRSTGESDLRLRTYAGDTDGVIVVDDYAADPSLMQIRAVVQGPRGSSRTVELEQTGPRRYQARFPLEGEGRYQVMAVALGGAATDAEQNASGGGARERRVFGGFVVPYLAEYLRFRSNPIAMRRIAERTGGRELRGDEDAAAIYGGEREPRRTSRPILDWLLIALACLIPLDVGLRRVQLDWGVIGAALRRKPGDADQRMSALLDRRKQVADRLRTGEPRTPAPPPSQEPTLVHRPAPSPPSDKPMSMTERLMAAKKRAQDQMKDGDKPSDH